MITFNPNKPMNWENFKQMPANIQAEYIAHLQQKYGATAVDLGEMFGVRALTVRKYAESHDLGVEFPRGHAMSAARRAEWLKFLESEVSEVSGESIVAQTDTDHRSDEFEQNDCVNGAVDASTLREGVVCPSTEPEQRGMSMKKFSLQFAGVIDVDMIANSLRLILGDQSDGELEIICNLL